MTKQEIAQAIQDIAAQAILLGFTDIRKTYKHPYFINAYGEGIMWAFEHTLMLSTNLMDMVQAAINDELETI